MVLYEFEKLQKENEVRQSIRIQHCENYPTKYSHQVVLKNKCINEAKIEFEILPVVEMWKIRIPIISCYAMLILTTYFLGNIESGRVNYYLVLSKTLISSALMIFVTVTLFKNGFLAKNFIIVSLSSIFCWILSVLLAVVNLIMDCKNVY